MELSLTLGCSTLLYSIDHALHLKWNRKYRNTYRNIVDLLFGPRDRPTGSSEPEIVFHEWSLSIALVPLNVTQYLALEVYITYPDVAYPGIIRYWFWSIIAVSWFLVVSNKVNSTGESRPSSSLGTLEQYIVNW